MAKHQLYGSQISSPLQEMTREGVPEGMGRDVFLDTSSPRVLFDEFPESLPRHRFATSGEEEVVTLGMFKELWSNLPQIPFEQVLSYLSDRYHTFFRTFSIGNEIASFQVNIIK